jgi:hypothetical protein
MRVVVDNTLLVSAALKERSVAGTTVHIVAESGVLLKSTIVSESRDHAAQPGTGDPPLLRRARGCFWVNTPIITASGAEGGAATGEDGRGGRAQSGAINGSLGK